MRLQKLLYPYFIFLLQGCNDSGVDQVKSLIYGYDESITLGNVLDHREICNHTQWREFKDEQGRDVVEYQCDLKGVRIYSSAEKSELIDAINNSKKNANKRLESVSLDINKDVSQKIKNMVILNSQSDIEKCDAEIEKIKNTPLPEKIKEIFQWGVVKGKEPTLVDITYNVSLSDKTIKVFHSNSEEQLEFRMKQSYIRKINNYSQLVINGGYYGDAPKWPF